MEGVLLGAGLVAVRVEGGALVEAARPQRGGPGGSRSIPRPPGKPAAVGQTASRVLPWGRHLACGLACLSARRGGPSREQWPLASRSSTTRRRAGSHASSATAGLRGERRGICS